jgi:very-short-patch-repair endonuclease
VKRPALTAAERQLRQAERESLEAAFDTFLRLVLPDLAEPVREYQFYADRLWRFDRAWPEERVAVEMEGGTYGQGRHVRPAGFEDDCWKYNTAAALGWAVLRFTGRMLVREPDECAALIVKALDRLKVMA